MRNKIALEEHFAIDLTIEQSKGYAPSHVWEMLKSNLLDIEQQRLERMEQGGTEYSILSLNSPGIQSIANAREAIEVATRANDVLAEHVSRHPTRLGGFAALPMQDPEAAARELERCVKELGFHGFLVNGFSQVGDEQSVAYYDAPRFPAFLSPPAPLFSVARPAAPASVATPFSPPPPPPRRAGEPIYDGAPWLTGPTWAF